MRVLRMTALAAALILVLLAAITLISYGFHRMTNPSFSPPTRSTTTHTTAMSETATSFRII